MNLIQLKEIIFLLEFVFVTFGQMSSNSNRKQVDYNYNQNEQYELSQNANEHSLRPLDRGPIFELTASKNVTGLVGKTAHLNCRIRNIGNKTVSWIRHKDLHLLTVGENTYTPDQRFSSIHNKQTGDWSLQVKYSQKRDSGIYECQVSTSPPMGFSMMLSIVEPITKILGGPDLYIDAGSTVNLTCIIINLPESPELIRWTHNNEDINYDSPRGGVSVITEKGDTTTSYLLIQRARISDSGRYTCSPSTANPQTVNVHVLNGEHPAAIQKGIRSTYNGILTVLSVVLTTASIHWILEGT